MLILVTGGARSGKSSFAEAYGARLAGQGVYIATAQAYDEEMRARIDLHRQQREQGGFDWATREEPFHLAETIEELSEYTSAEGESPVILADCLTLWLSNWLLRYENETDAQALLAAELKKLEEASLLFAGESHRDLILVTNEVGCGLVPEYELGRRFRDASGIMNQRLARSADQVFLVASGIPIELKSRRFELPPR